MTGDVVKAGRREWGGLAVLALPTFLVSFDIFVLLLALPHLTAALGTNSTQQLWIMDIYGFMVAGFMITMGTLGDRIGRRKLLLIGAAAFGVASVLSAYAGSPGVLIAARALLGIAGATLAPSTLALISNMFHDPKQRAAAIGLWGGTFTLGAIIGPIIGGVLLDHFWWGSVFLLGVPPMVLLLIIGPMLLPEYKAPRAGRIDLASVVLSLLAILPVIWGIKELGRNGWAALPIISIVAGVVFGTVFLRRQRRLADPLLDLTLFANRSFGATLASLLSYSLTGGAVMLFATQHFQSVDGLSPLQAGLAMLPGMATATVGFMVTPVLASKIRPAFIIAAGMVGTAIVLVTFTQVPTHATVPLIIGFAVFAFCGAPLVALGVNLVVGSAPPERAGSAASLAQICNEFGAALGIATVGTIGSAVYRTQLTDSIPSGLPAEAARTAQENVAGAVAVASHLPGQLATALLNPAREAFTSALHYVTGIGAVLLAAVAVLIATQLRHIGPIGAPQPADGPTEVTAETTTEVPDESDEPDLPLEEAV